MRNILRAVFIGLCAGTLVYLAAYGTIRGAVRDAIVDQRVEEVGDLVDKMRARIWSEGSIPVTVIDRDGASATFTVSTWADSVVIDQRRREVRSCLR